MKGDRIHLITPYFTARSSLRQRELDRCLESNLANPLIDSITLLLDDGTEVPFTSPKLNSCISRRRPTYRCWLEKVESERLDGIAILANSDIYFDDSLSRLHELLHGNNVFMALSRWEVCGERTERHASPEWSQDTWALRTDQSLPDSLKHRLDFQLGVPRCDNRVAYVFATAGWTVKNPIDHVRSFHLQESGERNYDKRGDTSIVGGVAYVHPTNDLASPSELDFDIWTLGRPLVRKVSLNTSLERWRSERDAEPFGPEARASAEQAPASKRPSPVEKGGKAATHSRLASMANILRNGRTLCRDVPANFSILATSDAALLRLGHAPKDWRIVSSDEQRNAHPADFFPELFGTIPSPKTDLVSERPLSDDDVDFWQFPCLTEKQACDNHQRFSPVSSSSTAEAVSVYVALPWATYIDHGSFPPRTIELVRREVFRSREVAKLFGYRVRVHTVCQHIRWRQAMPTMDVVGITDLWISHCTEEARLENSSATRSIQLHPWSLYAVNYCDNGRRMGLEPGKPIAARRLLASFIGAYMPHYLSDIRIRLCEALSDLDREDVIVDLGNSWHFNRTVYDHQVRRQALEESHLDEMSTSTFRYNQVLCDSRFSLCPAGAGPNTLRFWESIAVGTVPVLFEDNLVFPHSFATELQSLCVLWNRTELGAPLVDHLMSFGVEELQARSNRLMEIYSSIERMTCFEEG